jgi:hypothetical protein
MSASVTAVVEIERIKLGALSSFEGGGWSLQGVSLLGFSALRIWREQRKTGRLFFYNWINVCYDRVVNILLHIREVPNLNSDTEIDSYD